MVEPACGPRAERQHVQPLPRVGHPAVVAREHFHVGEQMVGKERRLGALQVRVGGHRRLGITCAQPDERALHPAQGARRISAISARRYSRRSSAT